MHQSVLDISDEQKLKAWTDEKKSELKLKGVDATSAVLAFRGKQIDILMPDRDGTWMLYKVRDPADVEEVRELTRKVRPGLINRSLA